MNYKQLIEIFGHIDSATKLSLPFNKSRDIVKLKRQLQPEWEFYIQEQNKLVGKYNGKINDNGTVTFADIDIRNKFNLEIETLLGIDFDIKIVPIKISCMEIGNQQISGEAIMAFDKIIIFGEDENDDNRNSQQ